MDKRETNDIDSTFYGKQEAQKNIMRNIFIYFIHFISFFIYLSEKMLLFNPIIFPMLDPKISLFNLFKTYTLTVIFLLFKRIELNFQIQT